MLVNETMPFDFVYYEKLQNKLSDNGVLWQLYFHVHFNEIYSTFPYHKKRLIMLVELHLTTNHVQCLIQYLNLYPETRYY